ncbi:MAG: hypothetical protein NTZ35_11945 [Ignavibacteriales bacterium]|nr:hypothetical protein [Ignavibacteriales bacterium]
MEQLSSASDKFVESDVLCVVSPDEDFQLAIARLLSDHHRVELCDDLREALDVALENETTIVIIDASLWKWGAVNTRIAARSLPADHRVSIIRIYPYQLEQESIESFLCDRVNSIFLRR